jgi:NADH:ubiquinone oxidoreductase subunit B-like Fe-S oxidoreductase
MYIAPVIKQNPEILKFRRISSLWHIKMFGTECTSVFVVHNFT